MKEITTFGEYQRLALRTARLGEHSREQHLRNAALGLFGESGEIADAIKKAEFQGHVLDVEHLKKEAGDVLWYVALLAHQTHTHLSWPEPPEWVDAVFNPVDFSLDVAQLVYAIRRDEDVFDAEVQRRAFWEVLSHLWDFARVYGTTLPEIAAMNIAKLERRYPNGQFEAARSQNREDVA
jgi:hypothetical protein